MEAARWSAWRWGLLAAACAAVGLAAGLWMQPSAEPPPVPEEPPVVEAPTPGGPRAVVLPIDRVARLVSTGGAGACALGGRRLACTDDGGATWSPAYQLQEAPLAVIRHGEALLVASVDGAIRTLEDEVLADSPPDLQVVDAAAHEGTLWLLAHRYDQPDDPLRLPRVIETRVLVFELEAGLADRGGHAGYAGERLLVLPDGSLRTWAPFDRRAWGSDDGGRSLRRLPDSTRFGADYGGLQVAVERRADRIPGPGRKAQPASAVVVAAGDEGWKTVLEATGEILVDFADATTGAALLRDEGAFLVTTDGARTFEEVWRDTRLGGAVALTHVDGNFLAATAEGLVFVLPLPEGD